MNPKLAFAVALASALILSSDKVLALDCTDGTGPGKSMAASSKVRAKGWIELHRPDGETVHIKTDQIVLVMSAIRTGAHKRARSKLQLLNGYVDVLESVERVMLVIKTSNDSGMPTDMAQGADYTC
jgi:hypothetical protein